MATVRGLPRKQFSVPEVVKALWTPVAGFAGAVVLVTRVIELWRNDQATVTFVTVGLGASLLIASLLWVILRRETYEVPDFTHPDRTLHRHDWRYGSSLRRAALVGLGLFVVGLVIGGYILYSHRQDLSQKTVVLIATFDGPKNKYDFTTELVGQVRAATVGETDIEVVPLGQTITDRQGSQYARSVGHRYLASIVLWGSYDPETSLALVHIENAAPGQTSTIGANQDFRISAALGELESVAIRQQLGRELATSVLVASGFADYHAHNYLGALVQYEAAASSINPQTSNFVDPSALSFLQANAYLSDKKYGQAITSLNNALNINPRDSASYLNRGLAYSALGEYGNAIGDYNRALQSDPSNAGAYLALGNVYLQQGNMAQALQEYDHSIQIDPNFTAAYLNRGTIYGNQGLYAKALEDYTQAIAINPNDPLLYFNRAVIYAGIGAKEGAISDYNRVINLATDPALRSAAQNELEKLK